MLLQKVILAVVVAATAYAGPCRPVTSKASGSLSGNPFSSTLTTAASDITDTATSGSKEPTSSVTVDDKTVTSGGSADSPTTTGSTSDKNLSTYTLIPSSQSTDATVTSEFTETSGTASTDTVTPGDFATGSTTADPTTEPTTEQTSGVTTQPTSDGTSDSTAQFSTTDTATTDASATEALTTSPTTTAEFCSENVNVVSELASDTAASPFCVGYLSMSTHTITEYQTIDPTNVYQLDLTTVTTDALTHIETGYDGVTVVETEYTTKIEWTTDTVTSTRSIETITCLDTAYSYTTPVPTFERGNAPFVKRGRGEIEIPSGLPSDWTEAQTSDACSCLDFEAPTTVTTVAQTVEPTTFITASTDVVTPIEEYTKIITTTSVDVVTSTVTEKKTSTVTAWVVETTFADNNDIAYRRFNCPFNANIYDDGFTTNYFKGKTPLSSGYMQSLQFSTCGSMTLPGSGTFDTSQAALLVNAYFYAKETGTYTFSVPDTIDNWGYLWLRDAAYTWNYGAWAIQGTRTGQNAALWKGGSYHIQLKKGDAIPFTYLWANGGGCAGNDLSVRTPSGRSIPGMQGSTVKACNVGKFT